MISKILRIQFLFIIFFMQNVFCDMSLEAVKEAMQNRTTVIEVDCFSFLHDDSVRKIKLCVLDVCAQSVKSIFQELLDARFPIYYAACYDAREIHNKAVPSLHALGAAIDVNEIMNPYYDAPACCMLPYSSADIYTNKALIMKYLSNFLLSEEEMRDICDKILQEEGYNDCFLNRNVKRPGMVGIDEAKIFKRNGFDVWGGMWRQPIDYMHFDFGRRLAESIISTSKENGQIMWADHLYNCRL